jgi:hypothetical protein
MDTSHRAVPRFLVVAAVVVGAALGSYGIAAAASGSGSTSSSAAACGDRSGATRRC